MAWVQHIFLSTPSARRATTRLGERRMTQSISIHALREEGDLPHPQPAAQRRYFYPRPPRGGRLCAAHCSCFCDKFLSTPSARRATRQDLRRHAQHAISIHALREEGDSTTSHPMQEISDFYPRPPRGGRLLVLFRRHFHAPISIHALREEGDARSVVTRAWHRYFYPRPPRGGRPIA